MSERRESSSFLTIPSRQALVEAAGDEEDEDDPALLSRLLPRSSPVPRRRGLSIIEDTAEYFKNRSQVSAERRVSFADAVGFDLVEVKFYHKFDSDDILATNKEVSEDVSPRYQVIPTFTSPDPCQLLQAVRAQKVEVERVWPAADDPLSLLGHVRVLNVSFQKCVYVRSTMDSWGTFFDYLADYVPDSSDGETDRFLFRLTFTAPYLTDGSRIEFVVRYESPEGVFWANNGGQNYAVVLKVTAKETTTAEEEEEENDEEEAEKYRESVPTVNKPHRGILKPVALRSRAEHEIPEMEDEHKVMERDTEETSADREHSSLAYPDINIEIPAVFKLSPSPDIQLQAEPYSAFEEVAPFSRIPLFPDQHDPHCTCESIPKTVLNEPWKTSVDVERQSSADTPIPPLPEQPETSIPKVQEPSDVSLNVVPSQGLTNGINSRLDSVTPPESGTLENQTECKMLEMQFAKDIESQVVFSSAASQFREKHTIKHSQLDYPLALESNVMENHELDGKGKILSPSQSGEDKSFLGNNNQTNISHSLELALKITSFDANESGFEKEVKEDKSQTEMLAGGAFGNVDKEWPEKTTSASPTRKTEEIKKQDSQEAEEKKIEKHYNQEAVDTDDKRNTERSARIDESRMASKSMLDSNKENEFGQKLEKSVASISYFSTPALKPEDVCNGEEVVQNREEVPTTVLANRKTDFNIPKDMPDPGHLDRNFQVQDNTVKEEQGAFKSRDVSRLEISDQKSSAAPGVGMQMDTFSVAEEESQGIQEVKTSESYCGNFQKEVCCTEVSRGGLACVVREPLFNQALCTSFSFLSCFVLIAVSLNYGGITFIIGIYLIYMYIENQRK
ncbi:uncharacterized protein si:ch211-167b20.8 [Erpetoichthys calabaricus]|uniref:uncharacterized protein si:ch211-167b20.8 n=1 Tax=Erpetoichthys calabaricus TaxID=27687 RepID=UPI002234A271|nr:uncharacterized protein si:ch211-167b20.8 [Erpetoichthys calabaricus]